MFLSLSTAQELVCMLFLFLGSTQNNKTKQIASLFKLQVLSLVSFCTVIPVLYVTNGGREWGPLGKPNFSLVYSSHFFFFWERESERIDENPFLAESLLGRQSIFAAELYHFYLHYQDTNTE